MTDWRSDVEEQNIDPEKTQFAWDQANLQMKQTLRNANILEGKAYAIAGVLVTLSTAIVGVVAAMWPDSGTFDSSYFTGVIPLIVLVFGFAVALWFVVDAIKPRAYYDVGNEPKNMLKNEINGTKLNVYHFR